MTALTLSYAFLGGLLPSCIWLYFLLKEDARHPEPKALIAFAFIVGMVAVPLALPFEEFIQSNIHAPAGILFAWALVEEFLKYGMAAIFILSRRAVDETPDYVVYMLTVALGFASAENTLFLLTPLTDGNIATSLFTDNVRFLGSTLLHVVASASIGFALAFSRGTDAVTRAASAAAGLILAVVLHASFNLLIMNQGTSTSIAFFFVWLIAVVFFAAFEVLKYFQYQTLTNPTRSL